MSTSESERNLLFGLLALQNGLIDQSALVAAFHAWTRDRARSLADYLIGRGNLAEDEREPLDALVALHLKRNGGQAEQSLRSLPVDGSARDALAGAVVAGDELTTSIMRLGSRPTEVADTAPDRTVTFALGGVSSDGQRFRILRPHARGGLGNVSVALDSELGREVALKQILEGHADDPEARARFLREAEITGGLEHPGIVPVYGLGVDRAGRPFYAMRFVRGETLKEAIQRHRKAGDPGSPRHTLELRKLLARFLAVCDAISYAHSRGVLHRDLKPSNILLGPYGETLVVDWGLARLQGRDQPGQDLAAEGPLVPLSHSGSSETVSGVAIGTPAYMSPEQAEGRLDRIGPASDVYNLGATLYCLLTGRAPVEGADVVSTLRRVRAGEIDPVRAVQADVPRPLEAICSKAMAPRPEDRYPSPRNLAEDIEHWLAGEPVGAWQEPWSVRAQRWLLRHRVRLSAAAASCVVAIVGLGAVLAVQARANQDLHERNTLLRLANNRAIQANRTLESAARREKRINADLRDANTRAQRRFDLALEAANGFQLRTSSDPALREPKLTALRQGLLGAVLEFYTKLQGALGEDPDPRAREDLAAAYIGAARITAEIGSIQDAIDAFQRALAIIEELLERDPTRPRRAMLAETLLELSEPLERAGRVEEAMSASRRALEAYESMSAGTTGDVASSSGRASALARIGYLDARTGALAASLEAYTEAVRISEAIARDSPANEAYRSRLARHLDEYGDRLDRAARRAEALDAYRRALGIRQRSADERPDDATAARDLGASLHKMGLTLRTGGSFAEAMPYYRRALELRERLAAAATSIAADRAGLAETIFDIGVLEVIAGRFPEAEALHLRALDLREQLLQENPTVTDSQSALAVVLFSLGELQARTGRLAEGLATLRRAASEIQRALRAAPEVAQYGFILALTDERIAHLELQNGEPGRALEAFRSVIALYERLVVSEPEIEAYLSSLARNLLACARLEAPGSPADSVAKLDRARTLMERLTREDPQLRYELAAGYALLAGPPAEGGISSTQERDARGRSCTAHALEELGRLIDHGFRDPARIEGDPAFNALRASTEFKRLIQDLAFPSDPFAR
jgi:serine/threonine-protein kinase